MVVPHYAYLVLKMPLPVGVLALQANLSIAYTYETESLTLAEATDLSIQMASVVTDAKTVTADDLEIPSLEPPHASTKSKEIKEVSLGLNDASKTMKIGAHLDPKLESALVSFLCANADVFAWKPADMPGVPREKIEHSLNVSPTAKPIKQKLR